MAHLGTHSKVRWGRETEGEKEEGRERGKWGERER